MKKILFWAAIFCVWIILLELLGSFFLINIGLDGSYKPNCNEANRIRRIMLDNAKPKDELRFLSLVNLNFIQNPQYINNGIKQNNSFGFRGKDVTLLPNADEIRILCIGGSTTYGYGVLEPDSSYPALLEKILREKTGKNYRVINAGLEGGTSFDEIQHYLYKLRYFKPNIVIIHSGGNDAISCAADSLESFYSPDFSDYRNIDLDIKIIAPIFKTFFASRVLSALYIYSTYGSFFYVENQGVIVAKKKRAPRWFHSNLNDVLKSDSSRFYYSFEKNYQTLIQLFKADSLKIIALPFALNDSFKSGKEEQFIYYKLNAMNNEMMHEICKKEKVTWVPYMYSSISPNLWLDDCHLNGNGNIEKALMILPFILDSTDSNNK